MKFSFFKIFIWKKNKNLIRNKIFFIKNFINLNKVTTFSCLHSNIYINFKYTSYNSKEKTYFLLNKYGFIYLTDIIIKSNFKWNIIINAKNNLYSFLYKNELERFILRRYTRNQILTDFLLLENQFSFKKNNQISQNNLFSFFSKFSFTNLLNFKNQISSLITSKHNSSKWVSQEEQISYLKNQINDNSDFNIKRIRFKPGYMSLWRNARKIFKLSLNLKMKYQYKLTRYLLRFKKLLKIKTYLHKEMQLKNILLKSRFLPDMISIDIFIKHGLIFLNGALCLNPLIQLLLGDLIQLVISIKYYILYKWFSNWILKKKIKLKEIVKKKINVRFNLEEKQRNYSLPKWVLQNKNIMDDTPRYLEIDYFTLSIIIIYEPFSWLDINYYSFINNKLGITNIYNWKYIT